MKSRLCQFKSLQDKPLQEILDKMAISEEKLLTLLEMWICQGKLSPLHPLFKPLKTRHDEAVKRARREKQRQVMYTYQHLRQKNYPKWKIAREMHCPPETLNSLFKKWYNHLRDNGYTDSEIASRLHASRSEMKPVILAYEERKRLHEAMRRQRLAENSQYARKHIEAIGKNLSQCQNYFIFDTEAVQRPDELIEIAIIDFQGKTVYNTLVRPTHLIDWRISALTGITNQMVEDQPTITQVMKDLQQITDNKTLMSWGIDYDRTLLKKSSAATGIALNCRFCCAQRIHMGLIEDINQIALSKAAGCPDQTHRALDDCHLVLDVIRKDMANTLHKQNIVLNPQPVSTAL